MSSITNKIVILKFNPLSDNIQCHQFSAYSKFSGDVSVTDDDDGGSANITSQQYVVGYNQSAGYMTGAGWIASPTGAYAPDQSFTFKGTFKISSKR